MKRSLRILLSVVALALACPAIAQYKMQTPAGEAPGPWIFGTIGVGKGTDPKVPNDTALKGVAIKLGEKGEAAIAYDLDLCRVVGGWTGKFTTPMNLMSRGEYPTALGEILFTAPATPGFRIGSDATVDWRDPRSEPFGPLPNDQVRFKGLHVAGDTRLLAWEIAGTAILEQPGFIADSQRKLSRFIRTFHVGPHEKPLIITIAAAKGSTGQFLDVFPRVGTSGVKRVGDVWVLELAASAEPRVEAVEVISADDEATVKQTVASLEMSRVTGDPRGWLEHKRSMWPEAVRTEGAIAEADRSQDAYVVDTIKLPEPNSWNAPMFIGGFDFFPDGRAAVCTFHGDVFIVSGIDDTLKKVTWRRFASGLYHALGLKVVNNEIYVTCRDGIYRLQDQNKDGEADFYEAFNYDVKVTKSFHEFVFDLHTDRDGYFYFAKAGPVKNGGRGFDEIMEHHGTLMRVSPDGKKLDVIATGFRAPNGIGVGPNLELTSGDNEGTWTPVCKINWINPQGFYGVVDLAHRPEKPTDYDRPLCWLPKRVDNSSGSQVWVTSEKWGPWQDQMLHLSYGQCALFGVLKEGVDVPEAPSCCSHVIQGGVVQFPVKFQSGIMRARFHPLDGQLYVAGLRGWQTTGLKNGAFQRVRYTGAPVRMPIALHAKKGGIEIQFTSSLDTQSAADPGNWNIEVWNYIWSAAYGSPEISTLGDADKPAEVGKDGTAQFTSAQMAKKGHDPLTVKSVKIGTDDRTVFLEIPDLKPVMQMSIKYQLKAADGAEIKGEIVNTIHALSEE